MCRGFVYFVVVFWLSLCPLIFSFNISFSYSLIMISHYQMSLLGRLLPPLVLIWSRNEYSQNAEWGKFLLSSGLLLLSSMKSKHVCSPSSSPCSIFPPHRESEYRVVETSHPYGTGKNQVKEFVHFPGAVALFLMFSPRSVTASRDDYVKLYHDEEFKVTMSKGGMSISNLSFSQESFPRNRVVLHGDSVGFYFQVGFFFFFFFFFYYLSFSLPF